MTATDDLGDLSKGDGMSDKRTKRIIAVFGGSKEESVLSLAGTLGRAIAQEQQILLTGELGRKVIRSRTAPSQAPTRRRGSG